jgi:hypothetical protein
LEKALLVQLFQKMLSAGYAPDACEPRYDSLTFYMPDRHDWLDYEAFIGDLPKFDMVFLLPTVLDRCKSADHCLAAARFLEQLIAARTLNPDLRIFGIVVLQCAPGQELLAGQRLKKMLSNRDAADVSGVISTQRSKVASINLVTATFIPAGVRIVGWMDDDVVLSSECVGILIRQFREHGYQGAIGPRKFGRPKRFRASRCLHSAKELMKTPATRYPHGCCILVEAAHLSQGIPTRYVCDDGYICFELLRPNRQNPQALLIVSDRGRCDHFVGGTWPEIYFRIRRSLLNLAIFVADYDWEIGHYFLSNIQFAGLWPLGSLETQNGYGRAVKKWILKAILFLWFGEICGELLIRALFRVPFSSISWAPYSWYGRVEGLGQSREELSDNNIAAIEGKPPARV